MSSLDEQEEAQRVLINAAMTASNISCWDAWQRYAEYTGIVDLFEIRAYLGGFVSLPVEECNLLAHAVNELIDERPPPPRAPHRGPIPWSLSATSVAESGTTLDRTFARWLMDTPHEESPHWPDL